MKLFSTRFFEAMAFSSASACASPTGAGSAIGWLRAMLRGTTASISARREAAPMAESISRSSSSQGPMWRGANSPSVSRARSGSSVDISMAGRLSAVRSK